MEHLRTILMIFSTLSLTEEVLCKLTIVDLTFDFDNSTLDWPTLEKWQFKLEDAGSNEQFKSFSFCAREHGGTHMDAPLHFAPGNMGAGEIDLSRLIGDGFIVDVSESVKSNRDFLITVDHITKEEITKNKKIDEKIVLFYTGFSSKYKNVTDYFGISPEDPSDFHFPGLSSDAAQWLVNKRNIKSLGIDAGSVDYGMSKDFATHRILTKANVPFFENVNLQDISKFKNKKDFMVHALPMKIRGGSGAPLRIVASYKDNISHQ